MSGKRIGVYPGTFDPVTKGHMDLIARSTRVVDHLIVAIATNPEKSPLFDIEERVEMMKAEVEALKAGNGTRIDVEPFDNLLMDFVREHDATLIIRGLRAVSDFEYEFQMAGMNQHINAAVETVFLTASDRHQFVASRLVKEVGRLGGDITSFVSARVRERLVARYAELNDKG